jgi:hypothetical protein
MYTTNESNMGLCSECRSNPKGIHRANAVYIYYIFYHDIVECCWCVTSLHCRGDAIVFWATPFSAARVRGV